MRRTMRLVLCVVVMEVLLASVFGSRAQSDSNTTIKVLFGPGSEVLRAELADSPEKHTRGLMGRRSMAKDEGMVFLFDRSSYLNFWMHNTYIPLTIIFVNEEYKIVDIQDMVPCIDKRAERCAVYTSRKPAKYAIEVNQGFAGRNGIKVGDHVTMRDTK